MERMIPGRTAIQRQRSLDVIIMSMACPQLHVHHRPPCTIGSTHMVEMLETRPLEKMS